MGLRWNDIDLNENISISILHVVITVKTNLKQKPVYVKVYFDNSLLTLIKNTKIMRKNGFSEKG